MQKTECEILEKKSMCNLPCDLREDDLQELRIREDNIQDLIKIQKIISIYECEDLALDEVLKRILDFYLQFVPYK